MCQGVVCPGGSNGSRLLQFSAAHGDYQQLTVVACQIDTLRLAVHVQQIELPGDMTVEEALEIYKDDPFVEYAEPNYYYYTSAAPNDTHFDSLWGLHSRLPDNNAK